MWLPEYSLWVAEGISNTYSQIPQTQFSCCMARLRNADTKRLQRADGGAASVIEARADLLKV
jgi:hypothetical protein